jgi:hypothetical protein
MQDILSFYKKRAFIPRCSHPLHPVMNAIVHGFIIAPRQSFCQPKMQQKFLFLQNRQKS